MEEVRLLLDGRAQPDLRDRNGKDALIHMIESNNCSPEIVRDLISRRASATTTDRFGSSAVREAAKRGVLGVVEVLLDGRADPNNMDSRFGVTALMRAAECGLSGPAFSVSQGPDEFLEVAEALLAAHADVNHQDFQGRSALMQAGFVERDDIVELLLGARADVHLQDKWGDTALSQAQDSNITTILEGLKQWE